MNELETIKIKSEDGQGYIVINKTDFDKDKHKEYFEEDKKIEIKANNKKDSKKGKK